MADINKTVAIIFQGQDDGASAIAAKVENSLNSLKEAGGLSALTQNLEKATQPLADLAVGALKFEAGFLAAGAAVTIFATKTASDFDTAFRQITTLFDASAEDVSKFRASIIEFASMSSQPIKNITDSLQAAIGSGVDYSKSLGLLSIAEKLAVATRADLTGTTEVLVSTLNAYGMKTDDAGKISDIFFKTIDEGKVEMNELANSFAMVTPLASASGVSMEELGAAVATLTASGVKAGPAIEYLRSLLTNIVKPSKQASEMADELGIKFDAATLKSKGLAGVLLDVGKAVDGDTGKMSKLVGDIGGLVAALALTGPQAARFAEILKEMGDVAGATDAAFAKMSGSLDISTAKIANAFRILMINVGTPLLDEFGGVANAITKVFSVLATNVSSGSLGTLVKYVEGIVGELGAVIDRVGENLPAALAKADLSGFTRGIDAVAGAFGKLFAGINLSTVDGLTKAVEFAGAAFLGLSRFTAGVIESFKPLFDFLVKLADGAAKMDSSFFEMAGTISGVATQMNLLAGGINGMLPAVEALLNLLIIKQGIGLLGSFKGLAAVLPGLPALLLALAAAAGSERIVALVSATLEWKKASDHLAESQRTTTAIQEAAIPTLERFARTTGLAVKTIDEANELVRTGAVVWDDAANGWVKAGDALTNTSEGAAESADAYAKKTLKSAEAMMVAADKAETLAMWGGKLNTSSTAAADGVDKVGTAATKTSKEAEKAEKAAAKLHLEMEKLASDERIKAMEFGVKLDIAKMEEDTKRIQAAFDSINNTMNSTGDVISSALGLLKDFDSLDWGAIRVIEQQLEQENKIRRENFDLQKQLTQAQIENLQAQTQQIEKGDALIKIDGAGLQPHLEAFMWEILKAIQVRVNRDGMHMLLGV